MTEHMCTTLTDGCYRCDLNRDEIEAIIAEDKADAQFAWLLYRDEFLANRRASRTQLRRREFIAGFLAGRLA